MGEVYDHRVAAAGGGHDGRRKAGRLAHAGRWQPGPGGELAFGDPVDHERREFRAGQVARIELGKLEPRILQQLVGTPGQVAAAADLLPDRLYPALPAGH